jgi:two-component system, OmpR family, sensor histidine kinase MprB
VTLRTKIVAALVLLAAAVTIAVGVFSYRVTADQLRTEIDRSLDTSAHALVADLKRGRPGFDRIPINGPDLGLVAVQVVDDEGQAAGRTSLALPVNEEDRRIAASAVPFESTRRDVTVAGTRYRLETMSFGSGFGAVQFARSLREYDRVLASLRNRVLVAGVIVMIGAGAIGWYIARQLTRRLTTLTTAAEEVAHTGRLDVAVPVQGADEAGRLGIAFNEMLAALARSKEDQQRLVQDAGHELRTPLTSLRTNMSVLRRHALEADARSQVLDDLDSETRELSALVNELVELATDRSRDEPEDDVALAEVARRVAQRAQRRSDRVVTVDADDTVVLGRRQALERAINNLVDNALKFDPQGHEPVEIVVRAGRVTVLDRGPGIAAADLPHVFDRFFRSVDARSSPGSGLGLSIVREVAVRHGGIVFAMARDGGGAAIGFELPVRRAEADEVEAVELDAEADAEADTGT